MEQNKEFTGWALIEIMGRDRAAGYVTTDYFGPVCMFRVETMALPEREFILKRPQYIDGVWTPEGATVKRGESPARTRFLGPSSIFSMTPCTEETAMAAIEEIYPRAMVLLKMPERPQLTEAVKPKDPVCGLEVETADMERYYAQHGETMYYFCSLDCQNEFTEAPEDYVEGSVEA